MKNNFLLTVQNDNSIIELSCAKNLSMQLNAINSSILFGCRTGICGTCMIQIVDGIENVNSADNDEIELLEILNDKFENSIRLACKTICNGNVTVNYIGKK